MNGWLGWLIGLAVLLALAPFAARLGNTHGRKVRGTASLALAMLGLGQIADPPKRAVIEAIEGEKEGPAANSGPKDATSGS